MAGFISRVGRVWFEWRRRAARGGRGWARHVPRPRILGPDPSELQFCGAAGWFFLEEVALGCGDEGSLAFRTRNGRALRARPFAVDHVPSSRTLGA